MIVFLKTEVSRSEIVKHMPHFTQWSFHQTLFYQYMSVCMYVYMHIYSYTFLSYVWQNSISIPISCTCKSITSKITNLVVLVCVHVYILGIESMQIWSIHENIFSKAFFLKCSCIKTSKTKKGRVLTIQINLKLPAIHPFGCNSREESSHCTHMPATTQSNSSYGVHPHATKSTKETKFTFHKVSIQRM